MNTSATYNEVSFNQKEDYVCLKCGYFTKGEDAWTYKHSLGNGTAEWQVCCPECWLKRHERHGIRKRNAITHSIEDYCGLS